LEIASALPLLAMTKGGVPRNDKRGACLVHDPEGSHYKRRALLVIITKGSIILS